MYIDIFPTIIRVFGIPDHGGKLFDGIDVYNVLTGKTPYISREVFSYNANDGDADEKITLPDSR